MAETPEEMMRVRILNTHDYTPPTRGRHVTYEHFAGQEKTVKRDHGLAMVKAGDAEEIDPPASAGDGSAEKPAVTATKGRQPRASKPKPAKAVEPVDPPAEAPAASPEE
jgi:hypothetical protein